MKNNAPSLPVPTESVEQQCLFRWAAFQSGRFPELALLYHVPNGGITENKPVYLDFDEVAAIVRVLSGEADAPPEDGGNEE